MSAQATHDTSATHCATGVAADVAADVAPSDLTTASKATAARDYWGVRLLREVACALHLLFVAARAYVRDWGRAVLGLRDADTHQATAYKIYAFNEGAGPGYFRELPPRYLDHDNWERDVKQITGFDTVRLEIRYTFRNRKYRMVLRPGDACRWPPCEEPGAPTCRLPRGVLSARLQGPLGSDVDCDVTSRVLKYQGPKGDFHAGLGLTVKMHDMFPFDEHDDNGARFSHLRVIDTTARVTDLPYGPNPDVPSALPKHKSVGMAN
jgi:hypothetical protein